MNSTLKLDIFFRNLLIALIIVYFSQGSFYAQGTIISQFALVFILSISGFYFVKVILLKNPHNFVKAWTALILLNIFGFMVTAEFIINSLHFDYLKSVLITLLPFYPFYYFALCGILKAKHLLIIFIFLLPSSILLFLNQEAKIMDATSREEVVNNAAYRFVGLLPFVFLIKKRILAMIALAIISYFVIMGAKRGAFLTGGLGIILYAYYQLRTIPKRDRFRAMLIILSGFSVLSVYAYRTYSKNEYLQQRMEGLEEGKYSGRDEIYSDIFNTWTGSESYTNLLFGYGFKGSIKIASGRVAHNDWLELLSNFGLLGFFVYLALFYTGFKSILNPHWGKNKQLLFLTILLIWFLITLFSMGYNSANFTGMFILIAYLIGSRSGKLI